MPQRRRKSRQRPGLRGLAADDLRGILDSDAKIPYVQKIGAHYYNFWKDKQHERGLWRRTTLAEYRKAEPAWETVLDIDALNKAEGENWVWHGADCLAPDYERCLVALSRGGADADVTREFDLDHQSLREGRLLPSRGQGRLGLDRPRHRLCLHRLRQGQMTSSGYPRIAKEWKRGTPMSDAEGRLRGQAGIDMYMAAYPRPHARLRARLRQSHLAFYNDELYLRGKDGSSPRSTPERRRRACTASGSLLELREPWTWAARTWPAGSLIATRFDDFMAGKRDFDVCSSPPTRLAGQLHLDADHLVTERAGRRQEPPVRADARARMNGTEPFVGAPAFGTIGISAVDDETRPTTTSDRHRLPDPDHAVLGASAAHPRSSSEMPAFFDASGCRRSASTSRPARTAQGAVLHGAPKDVADGANPTLLYGYGGFEVSMTPSYSGGVGAWLAQPGRRVCVANIRGGGEYGPRWHQAALKANRTRPTRTSPRGRRPDRAQDHLAEAPGHPGRQQRRPADGQHAHVMYPELFGAIVCQVPLLDMQRYHKLLAGASWMAEYGNPDDRRVGVPAALLARITTSKADVDYPPVLFTTSTRDDRVHPGHARKMMARMMQEQGHDVRYYENIEGGHGGAANNAGRLHALAYSFLLAIFRAPILLGRSLLIASEIHHVSTEEVSPVAECRVAECMRRRAARDRRKCAAGPSHTRSASHAAGGGTTSIRSESPPRCHPSGRVLLAAR
jgi:prolyl oligopeptidase